MQHPIIYILLVCLLLTGCGGPKSVGHGTEQAKITGVGYATDDPSQLRYPLSGKSLDKQLYFLNQPETMIQLQNYYQNALTDNQKENSNKYTNLQPREASPFRQ